VIGGELMAFRTDIINHLDQNSLSEDLQTSLTATVKGYLVKVVDGNVRESYPATITGIRNRTKRVVVGTILEYMRFDKSLHFECKYIFGAYTLSLILLPLLFFSSVLLFILMLLKIGAPVVYVIILSFAFLLFFLRNAIKFVAGILLGTLDAVLTLIRKKGSLNLSSNIREIWQDDK
jgi:hypothetical protein